MNKKSLGTTRNMAVHTRKKTKSLSCSTPENKKRVPSPVHEDSSPLCGSDADSPVPFLCTQDGGADIDVVWNYYTPKSDNNNTSPSTKDTPLSRKGKRIVKRKGSIHQEVPTKKKVFKASQKKIDLFKDLKAELLELNENVQCLLMGKLKKDEKKPNETETPTNDEDMFNDSFERSQQIEKARPSNTRHSLRKNVLSTKFPADEYAIESDDSINECLLKASQMVEERVRQEDNKEDIYFAQTQEAFNQHELSFESEFIKCDQIDFSKIISPAINKSIMRTMKHDSPAFSNDSFENILCNMNDSDVERLSQMPPAQKTNQKTTTNSHNKGKEAVFSFKTSKLDKPNNYNKNSNINNVALNSTNSVNGIQRLDKKNLNNGTSLWSVNESKVCDTVPSPKSAFGRHNSMPESPRVPPCKPSTSKTMLSRHNSMPQTCEDDSPPMKCTPDEIKRKHRLAKEKLLAKRLLPFTAPSIHPPIPEVSQPVKEKNLPKVPPSDTKFQFKVKTATQNVSNNNGCIVKGISGNDRTEINRNHVDNSHSKLDTAKPQLSTKDEPDIKDQNLKAIIEKKRTDAMLKLKRKRSQNNFPQ